MEQKSTGYYVVKALVGVAALLLGGATAKNGRPIKDPKAFNNAMRQGTQYTIDGVKGIYNN
ncbi:MAG: hypothetical protein II341_05975 [Oscillospiraceae bacterium]|nr:hypothetical protein [Oscillospiraceae bacterium]